MGVVRASTACHPSPHYLLAEPHDARDGPSKHPNCRTSRGRRTSEQTAARNRASHNFWRRCPKRRPLRPHRPVFRIVYRGGLHFGRHAPALPQKSSPSTGVPSAYPRKSSPRKPKNTEIGVFSARWANFFALTPTIGPRRANFFARRTQPCGDVETNDTTATADAGQHETTITTARPSTATVETGDTSATEKHAINTHFSPAKATPVSTGSHHQPAKATRVSIRRN